MLSLKSFASNPLIVAARARDEKEFFGQGWSHYPTSFQRSHDGVDFYLSVYNTPNHTQVNWNCRASGSDRNKYGDEVFVLFCATPEESRQLATEIDLPIGDWLAAALEACRTDVTADLMARTGNVVDAGTFHSSRAGDR